MANDGDGAGPVAKQKKPVDNRIAVALWWTFSVLILVILLDDSLRQVDAPRPSLFAFFSGHVVLFSCLGAALVVVSFLALVSLVMQESNPFEMALGLDGVAIEQAIIALVVQEAAKSAPRWSSRTSFVARSPVSRTASSSVRRQSLVRRRARRRDALLGLLRVAERRTNAAAASRSDQPHRSKREVDRAL